MASYTNDALQTINPGETVIFSITAVPCYKGLVRHRDGTGSFLLKGWVPYRCGSSANYRVDFGANIAVPTGQTAGPISVAITVDGATVPASTMIVTPAAVEEFFNVSGVVNVPVWRGCCETVSVRNTSSIPILMQNANIEISRPDLNITY